jgi:hypothetical protein
MNQSKELQALSVEDSARLKGLALRLLSNGGNISTASLGESHQELRSQLAAPEGYGWLEHDINLCYAAQDDYGNVGTTAKVLYLTKSLAPSTKRRYAYLHMFSGVTAKGSNAYEATANAIDNNFSWDMIFGVLSAFLSFLEVLKDVLGVIIKGWKDFVSKLPQVNEKTGNQNISDAWQSESDLAKKVSKVPPKKLPKPGKDNFPKLPDSSIKIMTAGEDYLVAATKEGAGAQVYFHSLDDDLYYGPITYDLAATCQLKYPNNSSTPFQLPSNCDHIALLWKNDPENTVENGGVWGKISVLEEN